MLLFLDHILYRRAHFIHDALCASRAVLAIRIDPFSVVTMWAENQKGNHKSGLLGKTNGGNLISVSSPFKVSCYDL